MRNLLTLALLAASILACSKSDSQSSGGLAAGGDHPAAYQRTAAAADGATEAFSVLPNAPALIAKQTAARDAQRMIVRTAAMSVIVADTRTSLDAITAAAERHGGYVNDSKVWRDGELLRASITLRVPAQNLTATLAEVRRLSKRVQSESMSSSEVTQEYVDLGSQLRNLEATEAELLQLMTTVREKTKRASDVLEMHQQISNVRREIEQIKGRMRYLEQVSAMSSVSLELVPDAIAQPVVQPGWQPLVVVKDAGRALVGALQGFASAAIWCGVYLLPVAAIFVCLALAGIKLLAIVRRAIRAQQLQ